EGADRCERPAAAASTLIADRSRARRPRERDGARRAHVGEARVVAEASRDPARVRARRADRRSEPGRPLAALDPRQWLASRGAGGTNHQVATLERRAGLGVLLGRVGERLGREREPDELGDRLAHRLGVGDLEGVLVVRDLLAQPLEILLYSARRRRLALFILGDPGPGRARADRSRRGDRTSDLALGRRGGHALVLGLGDLGRSTDLGLDPLDLRTLFRGGLAGRLLAVLFG